MGWLDSLLGRNVAEPVLRQAQDERVEISPAVPEALPAAPTPAQKRSAAEHVARFERAIVQTEAAIGHGEASEAYLAQLGRWRDYYAGLAALEAGRPDAAPDESGEG